MELRLPQDFRELFESLNAKGVDYLLIGGYAVIGHGYVRNTNDLDVVVRENHDNIERLILALEDFGFTVSDAQAAELLSPDNLVQLGVEPMLIEILNYIKGVSFEDAFSQRIRGSADGTPVNVISLANLIANKNAVGRLKDLADVDKLEKINAS